MSNIPLFRAKKQDSDEYAEGFYFENINWKLDYKNGDTKFTEHYICRGMPDTTSGTYKIDQTTLAIHFPDMLDSQGNKIFASLSEDGKGGDIIKVKDDWDEYGFMAGEERAVFYKKCCVRLVPKKQNNGTGHTIDDSIEDLTIIGIQE